MSKPSTPSAPSGIALPRWPLLAFVALCLVGLGVAADLTVIHYRVHVDPSYRSFCAISREVNCDTVAESDWSVFLGLPVSVWGILGYLLMGGLAAVGLARRGPGRAFPAGALVLLSGFSVAASIPLAVVSKLVIKSMCLMCIASWTVSLALLALAVVHARGVGVRAAIRADLAAVFGSPRLAGSFAALGIVLVGPLWAAYPRYWMPDGRIGPAGIATGRDEQGLPWIGAAQPKVTIVEFSDYQCPHCAGAHRELRGVLERYKDRVRLVHRNYPLDQSCNSSIKRPFHAAACERAAASVCAEEQGKFWEMSDLLFLGQRKGALDPQELAGTLGLDLERFRACMSAPQTREHVLRDVEAGQKAGVQGTPTFMVGEGKYPGRVPVEELEKLLSQAP